MSYWGNIIYKLPKGVDLSKDIEGRSVAYMEVRSFGRRFYVPITQELKKLLKIPMKAGRLQFTYEQHNALEHIFRDVLYGAELQLRKEIAGQIEDTMLEEVRDGFAKLFEKPIQAMVKQKLDQKLLEDGKNGTDPR